MSRLEQIWAGMLTDDSFFAGTDSSIVLIIHTGDHQGDALHYTFPDTAQEDQERGQANLYEVDNEAINDAFIPGAIDTEFLNPSSIRVGIRGSDQWTPQSFFVWGREKREEGAVIPLGLVMRLRASAVLGNALANVELSTDAGEGQISFPLPRVEPGGADTPIRSLIMLMRTADVDDAGTDDEIVLQIATNDGRVVVDHTVTDTSQDDQERAQANMYFVPAQILFTRRELNADSIRLSIKGEDAWLPASFFLFGLDAEVDSAFSDFVTPLVHLEDWPFGSLSTDSQEGVAQVILPLVTLPISPPA